MLLTWVSQEIFKWILACDWDRIYNFWNGFKYTLAIFYYVIMQMKFSELTIIKLKYQSALKMLYIL